MKKAYLGIFLAVCLFSTSTPAYAADIQIKIEGVAIASDVKPEMKNNRMMVPLRVISENIGAKVNYSGSDITLTKGDVKVILNLNSSTSVRNGKSVQLDVKPYTKNSRTMVPLRFLAEAFGCHVNYKDMTVTIDTNPLVIYGVKVKTLQQEFPMTMGSIVNHIHGNAYIDAIYNIFIHNSEAKLGAPSHYTWHYNAAEPGEYYAIGRFDFLDDQEYSIKRYDLYALVQSADDKATDEASEFLLHAPADDQWYSFRNTARQSLNEILNTASTNGFLKMVSNSAP